MADLRSLYGQDVDIDEPRQGVLIHGVHIGQVSYTIIESSTVLRYRTITLPEILDHHFGLFRHLLLLLNLDRKRLQEEVKKQAYKNFRNIKRYSLEKSKKSVFFNPLKATNC